MPCSARAPTVREGSRIRNRLQAFGLFAVVLFALLVVGARPASAHPLGNFTTNRYARVEVSAGVVRVYYVLDEAELRAFETREQVALIRDGLHLTVDATRLDLTPGPGRLNLLPGQAGLDTLRLAVVFSASLPPVAADSIDRASSYEGSFEDTNEPDRIGWREVTVVARGDAALEKSTAPAKDSSDELRNYPADLLRAPLDLRAATFTFQPGSRSVDPLSLTPPATAISRAGGGLTRLVERKQLSLPLLAGVLGLAFLFGSAHALGPGHGKTVMAAYLVGTQGRTVDAVLLGVIVSLMHTGSVLVLGLVLLRLDRFGAIERIFPTLTVVSGLAVIGFAAVLLIRRLRPLRASSADHDHDVSDDHDMAHDQNHLHGPGGHTHDLPEGAAPLSRRGIVLLATSGGLVPSPSAVLVVVAGFGAGRVALGLSIVLSFSIGLAATLSAVGTALVLGRRVLERRGGGKLVRVLPVFGALALLGVGLFLFSSGMKNLI